jgi:5-methylthioadenosine/S-adenosylhomocysteine deaminase
LPIAPGRRRFWFGIRAVQHNSRRCLLAGTITLAQNVVGQNVRTVVVDGRVVMKDREFLTVDIAAMRAKVNVRYPLILSRYEKAIA